VAGKGGADVHVTGREEQHQVTDHHVHAAARQTAHAADQHGKRRGLSSLGCMAQTQGASKQLR
jgi:hypothetical protein